MATNSFRAGEPAPKLAFRVHRFRILPMHGGPVPGHQAPADWQRRLLAGLQCMGDCPPRPRQAAPGQTGRQPRLDELAAQVASLQRRLQEETGARQRAVDAWQRCRRRFHNLLEETRDAGRSLDPTGPAGPTGPPRPAGPSEPDDLPQAGLAHAQRLELMAALAPALAHELSQPLTSVVADADTCLRLMPESALVTAAQRECLGRIATQATRAADLLRRLRRFTSGAAPERSPTDLNAVVRSALALLVADARTRAVPIHLALAADLPAVEVDAVQIEQVLVNLARNALEAMAETPAERRELQVETALAHDASVVTTVADRGPGLSPAALDRLFQPFASAKPGGLGLGLWLSRALVEAHGGRLDASPRPGGGTTLQFALPLPRTR
jgi:signal transduction histidine kinase